MYVFTNTIACILARSKSLLTGGGTPTPPAGPVATLDFNPASGVFASTIGPTPAFSRASAATMIDAAGKVVWGPENLIAQSQDIGAWALLEQGAGSSTTSNAAVDPLGGNTASRLVLNGVSTQVYNTLAAPIAGQFTFSCWLRAESGSATVKFNFNHSGQRSPALVITSAWQRFSFTSTENPISNVSFFSEGGTNTFLAWGAQLERSPVARTYLPTTTAPVYGPRITYDPITHECLGYLAEEQRTNKVLSSSNLGSTSWLNYVSSAKIENYGQAPDGSNSSAQVTFADAGGGLTQIYQLPAPESPPGTYTISVWLRASANTTVLLSHTDGATDLQSPPVNITTQWKRAVMTFTSVGNVVKVAIFADPAGVFPTVFEVWGFQLEPGNFPTSYIPTTTAAATRSADLCSISGADFTGFYNQTEGTVVANVTFQSLAADACIWNANNANPNNSAGIFSFSGVASALIYSLGSSEVNQGIGPLLSGVPQKVATALKTNDFSSVLNGGAASTDASCVLPIPNQFVIGAWTGNYYLNGTIARLQYFPERLPDAKLIELTQP